MGPAQARKSISEGQLGCPLSVPDQRRAPRRAAPTRAEAAAKIQALARSKRVRAAAAL
jgi:hypothetical protein